MPAPTSSRTIAPHGVAVKIASAILLAAFALAAALYLTGCTAKGTTYKAPSAEKLVAKQQSATRHFAAAKVKFAAASVGLRATTASHTKALASQAEATRWVTLLAPGVEALKLKAPAELQPEIEALTARVATLRAEIDKTTGEMAVTARLLAGTQADQTGGTTELERGTADLREIAATLAPEHFAAVEKLAAQATAESAAAAQWHNKYDALNRQTWMHRILGIAGALAVAGLVFLWLTGRLAGAGAKAAAALR